MMLTGNYVFMICYGENGVAAFSIACYLFPLIFMISNAVAQSAQPIISYNYGAGAEKRVAPAFRISLIVAAICGTLSFASLGVGAKGIVSMFISPDSEAGLLCPDCRYIRFVQCFLHSIFRSSDIIKASKKQ